LPFLSPKEIREMHEDQRIQRLSELRAELSKLRTMSKAGGAFENPSRIREIRNAIARILTIENETKARGKTPQ
jgi:large subunit ribosomal protein L29